MTMRREWIFLMCAFLLSTGTQAFAVDPFGDDSVTPAGKTSISETAVVPAPTAKPASIPSVKTPANGPQTSQKIQASDILIALQEVDIALINYRNYEGINSRKNAGFFAAAGFTAAAATLDKKRKILDFLITNAKPEDLPEIADIRQAYQAFQSCMKGYLVAAGVGGILSGPNARATTASYLLVVAASTKFKNSLIQIQRASVAKSTEQNSALKQAEQTEKDAYDKLQLLIKQGTDGETVKAAAKEYDDAKKALELLKVN
ncbi:MAG: hypothetical protein WA705_25170 [Candidatus Ozemobacteraceae bacterium]